jgi:hypothetical protein
MKLANLTNREDTKLLKEGPFNYDSRVAHLQNKMVGRLIDVYDDALNMQKLETNI